MELDVTIAKLLDTRVVVFVVEDVLVNHEIVVATDTEEPSVSVPTANVTAAVDLQDEVDVVVNLAVSTLQDLRDVGVVVVRVERERTVHPLALLEVFERLQVLPTGTQDAIVRAVVRVLITGRVVAVLRHVDEAIERVAVLVKFEVGAVTGEILEHRDSAIDIRMLGVEVNLVTLKLLRPEVVKSLEAVALVVASVCTTRVEEVLTRVLGEHRVNELL